MFCRGRDDNDRWVGACAALFDRGYLDLEFDRLYRCVYRIMGDCLDSRPVYANAVFRAALQVVLGGSLVFGIGIVIGSG